MPFTKINRNAYFFEIVAEQDITLDFEVILLPNPSFNINESIEKLMEVRDGFRIY